LVINKCVTAVKVSNFSGHYLHNRSTLDIGVLGYIGIVQHKEHCPEILSIPPGTPCISYIVSAFLWQFSPVSLNRYFKFNLYITPYYTKCGLIQVTVAKG